MTRPWIFAPCFLVAALQAGTASADPPQGWEAPPQLPQPKKPGKSERPALCGADETCCARQLEMNRASPDRIGRVVEVPLATLPELVVKEAPEGGPPVTGAPGVRIVDGLGRPAPWADDPKSEVRVLLLGRYGELTWGEGWDVREPFFAAPERRSLGYGVVHGITRHTWSADGHWQESDQARAMLTGKVIFTTLDQGPGDTIAVDYVKGKLAGTPEVEVARWGHVDAAPVTDGFVHAFRGWPPAEAMAGEAPVDPGAAVTFVMPTSFLEFDSRDARHSGGHFRQAAYKTVTLPVGAGRSGLVLVGVFDDEIARWFPRRGAPRPEAVSQMVLSSSQTSAEAAPRVRVMFRVPRARP